MKTITFVKMVEMKVPVFPKRVKLNKEPPWQHQNFRLDQAMIKLLLNGPN